MRRGDDRAEYTHDRSPPLTASPEPSDAAGPSRLQHYFWPGQIELVGPSAYTVFPTSGAPMTGERTDITSKLQAVTRDDYMGEMLRLLRIGGRE